MLFFFDLDFDVIKSRKVKEIMTQTDRKHYCAETPYVDAPQSIGNGVTISAPHMVIVIESQSCASIEFFFIYLSHFICHF